MPLVTNISHEFGYSSDEHGDKTNETVCIMILCNNVLFSTEYLGML